MRRSSQTPSDWGWHFNSAYVGSTENPVGNKVPGARSLRVEAMPQIEGHLAKSSISLPTPTFTHMFSFAFQAPSA
jgi:hypothetical protein